MEAEVTESATDSAAWRAMMSTNPAAAAPLMAVAVSTPPSAPALDDDGIEDVSDAAELVAHDDDPPHPIESGIRLAKPDAKARTAAFRCMYDAHFDFVWRNLRRLGVPVAETDDKAQEVFVVAYRRFDDFVDRGFGLRAWLFQITLRVASDARRHRRRHPEDPDGGAALESHSVDAPQAVALGRKEELSRLDAALGTIDVGRRAVLVLHEIEEMTAPEIARALEIPLNTVYSRLRVAREELAQALGVRSRAGGAR
jgi:RNA polymerase sigma-70 factor (ECF subfamily)